MSGETDPAVCLLQQGWSSSLTEGSARYTFTTGPLRMLFSLPGTLSKIPPSLQECELEVGRASCTGHCCVLVPSSSIQRLPWDVLTERQSDKNLKALFLWVLVSAHHLSRILSGWLLLAT